MRPQVWMSTVSTVGRGTDVGDLTLPEMELPEAGSDDEGEGPEEEAPIDISLTTTEGDPFDDRAADDLPLESEIDLTEEPTVVGDDDDGLAAHDGEDDGLAAHDGEHGLGLGDQDGSLLDHGGHAEEGLEVSSDEELGIDPVPGETDDGGVEGLDEPGEADVDDDFPPLDGAADDDDEVDVGIELPLDPG